MHWGKNKAVTKWSELKWKSLPAFSFDRGESQAIKKKKTNSTLKMFSHHILPLQPAPHKEHTYNLGKRCAKLPCAFAISNYLSPVCISGPIIAGADEMAQFSSHCFRNSLKEAEEYNSPHIAKSPNGSPANADDRDVLRDSGITWYSAELNHFLQQWHPGAGSYSAATAKNASDCRSAGKLPLTPTSPSSTSQTKLNRMSWIVWP